MIIVLEENGKRVLTMREILFRGKRVDNGEWFYGVPTIDSRGQTVIVENVFDCDEYNCRGASCLYIDENTIGQYTGLTDKNGKKIFEGDIIQFCTGMKLHYIVEFGLGGFMVSRYDIRDAIINVYNCPCEVIGNIHDNPELLKEGDDK